MQDIEVTCRNCNRIFVIRQSEQELYSVRRRPFSEYCPICRRLCRAEKEKERKQREDAQWQIRKAEDAKRYDEMLEQLRDQNICVLSLEELADVVMEMQDDSVNTAPQAQTLYVIGNGFDLMHGVRSSYYDFGKTIGKKSTLRFYLDYYLQAENLWADFEGALAQINVEAMAQSYIVDNFLEDMNAYDEDAQAADFFAAAEMAAAPITEISSEMPKRFDQWIRTLEIFTENRPLRNIIGDGRFLDFNYTEFIETLYGVESCDVCYIHGSRKKEKGKPKEKLILGHQPKASDAQYDYRENWGGIHLPGNHAQMLYDATQVTLRTIADADDQLTKHCDEIIAAHHSFFEELSDIRKIITIGHSLYPVDWDYFEEAIRQNHDSGQIAWYFGCYGIGDLERVQCFIRHFGIDQRNVRIFRTDKISVRVKPKKDVRPGVPPETGKIIGKSKSGRWTVRTCNGQVNIVDDSGETVLCRVFTSDMNGAVFTDEDTCFLIQRGVDKGIFLLRWKDGEWRYLGELQEIPKQGVITKRLHRIQIEEDKIYFIYQSRMRVYSLTDGALIQNRGMQQAAKRTYPGMDVTQMFQRIYKNGFY